MQLDLSLHERVVETKDWATLLFFIALALVVVAKSIASIRFNDFIKIIFSDKYLKIYKDPSNLMSWFTVILFVVQLISFSFLFLISVDTFGMTSKYDLVAFIQILTFLSFFIFSKFLLDKIIATSFNVEEFAEQFNLLKVSYRTFLGLILLPFLFYLYYLEQVSQYIIYLIFAIILIYNIVTYYLSIRLHQSLIINQLFYFILYLCALEIIPYYFIYYWFTKA
jgi:hypothetical protein